MSSKSVLLVEDESLLAEIISETLESRNFVVHTAPNGVEGLKKYTETRPDICILDVMMPEMDGFTMAEHIRQRDEQTPIIFVTAKSQTSDLKKGFDVGANDYIKKPFSIEELIVRMNALLDRREKRSSVSSEDLTNCVIGEFLFDHTRQTLKGPDADTRLTGREADVLKMLYLSRNQTADKAEVLKAVWGENTFFNGRSMDVFVTKLRKYLRADPAVEIINVRGKGYKLIC